MSAQNETFGDLSQKGMSLLDEPDIVPDSRLGISSKSGNKKIMAGGLIVVLGALAGVAVFMQQPQDTHPALNMGQNTPAHSLTDSVESPKPIGAGQVASGQLVVASPTPIESAAQPAQSPTSTPQPDSSLIQAPIAPVQLSPLTKPIPAPQPISQAVTAPSVARPDLFPESRSDEGTEVDAYREKLKVRKAKPVVKVATKPTKPKREIEDSQGTPPLMDTSSREEGVTREEIIILQGNR